MIYLGMRAQTVDEDLEAVLEIVEQMAELGWQDLHVTLQMATDLAALTTAVRTRLQALQAMLGEDLEVTEPPEASPPTT